MTSTATRPEKYAEMDRTIFALRNMLAKEVKGNELNLAEALSCVVHVLTSILVSAYSSDEDREATLSLLPGLVRTYTPSWQRMYAEFRNQNDLNKQ